MNHPILCLWFPRWPLERLLAAQPDLRTRRILLYEQTPQRSLRIVAATDPAARPGMPLAEALAAQSAECGVGPSAECGVRSAELKKDEKRGVQNSFHSALRTPHSALPLHTECHDPWADRQALVELAEACHRYSPTVGIEDTPRPTCLFLELPDLSAVCGVRSAELSAFTVRAAVADTIGAAWGLARYGAWENAESNGSSLRTPHSALRTSSHSAIASLPLAALRLPDDTLALLGRLGLHRVGQVEALPRAALASRFGPQLLLRLDQMFGRAAETLLVPRAAAEFAAECCFETPIEDQETIEAVCRKLVREVAAPLAARQEGAVQLECRFDCSSNEPVRLAVGLFRPSAAAEHLWQLLRLRLESLRLPAAVTAVRLEVLASAPLAWQQQELFETDRCPDVSRQTALLIDRLSNRLGRQAVVRGVPLSDAQPEHASMCVPLAGEPIPRVVRSQPARRAGKRFMALSNGSAPQGDERPLFLKPQPILLQQVLGAPGGGPRAFRLSGRDYPLAQAWGPERIETGWWRSGLVRRDYYRVETTTGSQYWIFHDLRAKRWFLHGEFG